MGLKAENRLSASADHAHGYLCVKKMPMENENVIMTHSGVTLSGIALSDGTTGIYIPKTGTDRDGFAYETHTDLVGSTVRIRSRRPIGHFKQDCIVVYAAYQNAYDASVSHCNMKDPRPWFCWGNMKDPTKITVLTCPEARERRERDEEFVKH